jgi:hypothetical protein
LTTYGTTPQYYSSGGGADGSSPFISFNRASSQYVDGGSRTFLINTNGGFTSVVYMAFTGTAGSYEAIHEFANSLSGGGGDTLLRRYSTTTQLQSFFCVPNCQSLVSPMGTIVQNEWAIFGLRYSKSLNVIQIIKNDAVVVSATVSQAISDYTYAATLIGANYAFTRLNANIAGIYAYDRYLTDAEFSSAANYLKSLGKH